MKVTKIITEDFLVSIPVPEQTSTYIPIAHYTIISELCSKLQQNNIDVVNKQYTANESGTQMFGRFDLNKGNGEVGMSIYFRNSYDKILSLAMSSGAGSYICSNGMVKGELMMIKKHQGTIAEELSSIIDQTIQLAETNYQNILTDVAFMKDVKVSTRTVAEIIGRLLYEFQVITTMQANIIMNEMKHPSFDYPVQERDTLYGLYNHVTHSLKQSRPMLAMNNYKKAHDIFTKELI